MTSAATTDQGTITRKQWADMVLVAGGWPVTANNEDSILNWMASENAPSTWTGTAGANNPLNNGLGSGGGSGLGSYSDLQTAADYVAQNIHADDYGYQAIDAALASSADPSTFAAAVINSDWAGGHYDGGSKWSTTGSNPIYDAITAAQSFASGATKGGTTLGAAKTSTGSGDSSGGPGIVGQIEGLVPGLGAVSGAAALEQSLIKPIELLSSLSFWERVGMFLLGGFIFIIGLTIFASSNDKVQSTASEAAPLVEAVAVA